MYFNTEGDRFTKKLIHGEILHIKIQLLKSVLNGLVTDEALQVTMPFILKLDPVILETVDTWQGDMLRTGKMKILKIH